MNGRLPLLPLLFLAACSSAPPASDDAGAGGTPAVIEGEDGNLRVLVFSRTEQFRHASIPEGVAAFGQLAHEQGWGLVATEDPELFNDESLAQFDVVVFLLTTGDVLAPAQEAAFERFIRSGKGFVGVHSAADTEYDWPWYGGLVGAYFKGHDLVQSARVIVEGQHPALSALPSPWLREDEWYGFTENPRGRVKVLLSLDEGSFTAGAGEMGGDHPIAWYHDYDGGRAFYTGLGHTSESYAEPEFLSHLIGGVEWAGRPD